MVVLGISANSRIVGIAIIQNNELVDYSIRLFKEGWSNSKAVRIIASLAPCIGHPSITHVALAIPHVHYTTKETAALIARITTYCKRENIPITTIHQETLRFAFRKTKASKKDLMEQLSGRYPELRLMQQRELRNSRNHYHKLFEAVAVGAMVEERRNNNRR
jgi:RNase H-fold protein (predicted Holliday junction resolvase)